MNASASLPSANLIEISLPSASPDFVNTSTNDFGSILHVARLIVVRVIEHLSNIPPRSPRTFSSVASI